jgi:hypothetical protein
MRLQGTGAARACEPGSRFGRQSAATLIEVLVSIFVMGIGLLALLVLFPLGALNMAQAIRNDRCAQAALNAAAIARFLPHDNTANASYTPATKLTYGIRSDPAVTPYYTTPPASSSLPTVNSGLSYPVYVDPLGAHINPTVIPNPSPPPAQFCLGPPLGYAPPQLASAGPITGITRVMPQYLFDAPQNQPVALNPPVKFSYLTSRFFTLLDDVTFTSNGLPDVTSGNIEREGRYTWCYMLQMPSASDPITTTTNSRLQANLTIVVYDRRPVVLDGTLPAGASQPPQGERSFMAKFDEASNTATLTWDPTLQDPPALRRGSWLLDATMSPIHGYFYRVVGTSAPVKVSGNVTTMDVELQNNALASVQQGVAVVMENVVEVFARGAHK